MKITNNPNHYNTNTAFRCKYIPNLFSTYTNKYLKKCSHDAFVREIDNIPEILNMVNEVNIPISRNLSTTAWDINPTGSNKYVMFLHGMAMNISNYQKFYQSLLKNNIGIFALEYRGYGKNANLQATEKTLNKDVEKGYQYLTEQKGIKPENIIIVGSCAGGALGANLVSKKKNINSLIMIAPLTSQGYLHEKFINDKNVFEGMPKFIQKLIRRNKFFKWIYQQQFNTLNAAKKIKTTSLYIIQSRLDNVARTGGARKLVNIASKNGVLKEFCLLEHPGHKINNEKTEITSRIIGNILVNM